MATEIMPVKQAQQAAIARLDQYMGMIQQLIQDPYAQRSLPAVLRFVIAMNPDLALCNLDRLVFSVVEVAWLGFRPQILGQAWIVPWKLRGRYVPQVMIGYQGMCELALRSDRVSKIWGTVVHEHDEFEVMEDLGRVHHRRAKGHRGDPIGAYGSYQTVVGGIETAPVQLYMDRAEILEHKAMSAGARRDDSPWNSDQWPVQRAMWIKTPIRVMYKTMPKSTHMSKAAALDEQGEVLGRRQSFELDILAGGDAVEDIVQEQDLDRLEEQCGD